jgi:hypothetical protein
MTKLEISIFNSLARFDNQGSAGPTVVESTLYVDEGSAAPTVREGEDLRQNPVNEIASPSGQARFIPGLLTI